MGGWLITAGHHQRHHDRYACNYGLYFRIWDRLCGTDAGVGDFARDRAQARLRRARLLLLGGASPVADLTIAITGVRSEVGELRLCLTANPRKFPSCVGDDRAIARSVPADQRAVRFTGLPSGDWAVAVIHDANGNARLDTLLGIPT